MKNRVLTSIAIVLTLTLLFVLKVLVSSYFFDVLFVIIALIASFETSRLFTKMGKYNYMMLSIAFVLVLGLSNLLGIIYENSIGLSFVLLIDFGLIVLAFAGAFAYGLITYNKSRNEMKIRKLDKRTSLTKFAFTKALNTAVTFIYPSFILLLLMFINHLDSFTLTFATATKFGGYLSLTALLFVFLIPIFTDTFAYLVGGVIGGKKLAPKVSPLKTISGAIGGVFFCVLYSVAVYFVLNSITPIYLAYHEANFTIWHVLILSFLGSIVAQLGDLFESLLKRMASVKDSGKIFPGHGGMLDRIDSYLFVIPYLLVVFVIFLAII